MVDFVNQLRVDEDIESGSTNPQRTAITHAMITAAEDHLENWDNLSASSYLSQQYGFKYEARFTKHAGSHMFVSKCTVPGLNMARYEAFHANYFEELS